EKPETLHDLQKLLGTINWVRSLLGITKEDLVLLFALLSSGSGLNSPRQLTDEARDALDKVSHAIQTRQAHRINPNLPFLLAILGKGPQPHALIFQWGPEVSDPLLILEWVFLPHQPGKTITKPEMMAQLVIRARSRLLSLAGKDFSTIFLPITTLYLGWLLQQSECLQIALENFTGQISIHFLKHRLLHSSLSLIPKPLKSVVPLDALIIFNNGSGWSHKSVITWQNPITHDWESDIETVEGSSQIAELAAVVRAFSKFTCPFNLITDSTYFAGIVERAENAFLKTVSN
ncbi:POK19 protein, partial [Ploceus nigricollis]|nr:POK19 protein [Ploceus nigricollis]